MARRCSAPTRWWAKWSRSSRATPYNLDAIAFTGFDFLGGGYRNNAATIFVTQTDWDERPVPVQALVGELFMKTGAHQGGAGAGVQPAADLRPRHRGRLRVLRAEPRRGRLAAAGAGVAAVHGRGQQEPDAGRRADAVARQLAAAVCGRRPRARQGARRAGGRAVQHAVGHARQLLRQRLQQVRPHLAGVDVGRGRLSQAARRHRPHVGALRQRRDGAGVGAGDA